MSGAGFSVTLSIGSDGRDEVLAGLWEAGTTGITEDEDWIRAFFNDDVHPAQVVAQFRMWNPRVEIEEEYDWVQHAQSLWQPFAVGRRFWLVPEWEKDPAPEGRLRLAIRPGLACGSGWHPATRLCLEALEELVEPGARVLDAGVGSGILSEAALLLGAHAAWGCDVDPEATPIARRNVPGALVFTGSLDAVRDGVADVVVANISAAGVSALSADLRRVARGAIVVSGFQEHEIPEELPRPAVRILELDGWCCVVC